MVNRLFMKLFRTSNIVTVHYCQNVFGCELPSVLLARRYDKFIKKIVCSVQLLVKLLYFSVLLLCFLAIVTVNKDEY